MHDALVFPTGATGEDTSSFPVLIIPGYGTPGYQTRWVGKQIQSRGLNTVGLKLPWLGVGDMRRSAEIVAEHVEMMRDRHGFEKVNLFGFSLGGLIVKYYLQMLEGHRLMGRATFLAPPLAGAYLGYLGYFTPAGRQVRPGSFFLQELDGTPGEERWSERCLSIYVRWDGVIVPSESAHLPTGYNLRLSRPVSHWGVVLNRRLIHCATEFLKGSIPEGAEPGRELKIKDAPCIYPVTPQLPVKGHGITLRAVLDPFKALARRSRALFRRTG